MTKTELSEKLAERTGLSRSRSVEVVTALFDIIGDALKRGESVAVPGFGKFYVSLRAARRGRNPATGEIVEIPERKVPAFKSGAALKRAVM